MNDESPDIPATYLGHPVATIVKRASGDSPTKFIRHAVHPDDQRAAVCGYELSPRGQRAPSFTAEELHDCKFCVRMLSGSTPGVLIEGARRALRLDPAMVQLLDELTAALGEMIRDIEEPSRQLRSAVHRLEKGFATYRVRHARQVPRGRPQE